MSDSFATPSTTKPVLTIAPDRDLVTVIERFDVPPPQQADAIAEAITHIARQWKADPSFIGAFLLRGRNRGGIACYSQWKLAAGDADSNAPASSQSLAAALPSFKLLDSRTYTVDFTHQAKSIAPPTHVSLQQTPHAHFGIFSVTPENQDRLLAIARENAPRSLTTPDLGLLAINFHRSVDGLQVINLGVWATLDNFMALLQRPGFRDDNQYWEGVADFQPDFFDVVAVEAV